MFSDWESKLQPSDAWDDAGPPRQGQKIQIFKGWAKFEVNNIWKYLKIFSGHKIFFRENATSNFNQHTVLVYVPLFFKAVVQHLVMQKFEGLLLSSVCFAIGFNGCHHWQKTFHRHNINWTDALQVNLGVWRQMHLYISGSLLGFQFGGNNFLMDPIWSPLFVTSGVTAGTLFWKHEDQLCLYLVPFCLP